MQSRIALVLFLANLTLTPAVFAICAGMQPRVPPSPRPKPPEPPPGYRPLPKTPISPEMPKRYSPPPRHPSSSVASSTAKSSMTSKVVSTGAYRKPAGPSDYSQRQKAASQQGGDDDAEDAIAWIYSVEDAMRIAAEDGSPFAIYFCSENMAKVAGEGAKVRAAYPDKNGGESAPPPTIFEQPEVIASLDTVGLNKFVKISSAAENKAIFTKFEATINTLVICAPDASALNTFSGTECNDKAITDWAKMSLYDALANWARKDAWRKADERRKKNEVITPIMDSRLSGCFQITPRVFSGSRLWDDACYQALQKLKVAWIVSVSAAPPDEEMAQEFGIGVIHLPIAFNHVPRHTALMLGRCVHDLSGGIYFCADNGKDRAAVAAIIASIVVGELDAGKAALALQQAGVPQEFKGLHASVLATTKTEAKEFFSFKMEFNPRAQPSAMAERMNDWQLSWDKVQVAQMQDWIVPEAWKAIDPLADAQALHQLHKHLAAAPETKAQTEYYRKLLWEGETATNNLVTALKDWKRGVKPANAAALDAAVTAVTKSCNACHGQYRDNLAPARLAPKE